MNRREFLAASAAAPLAALLRAPADKAACSSLLLYKQPFETAARTIAGLGYRFIDVSLMRWAAHGRVDALAADFDAERSRLSGLLESHGLGVSNLTFDAVDTRKDFDADYLPAFGLVADLAKALGTGLVNLMAPKPSLPWKECVRRLSRCVEAAAARGVKLSVETHVNQITEMPADAVRLCREVKGLGLTLDPCHFHAGRNQGKSFDETYSFAYGTGLRASGRTPKELQVPWGEGPIDFAEVVRNLVRAGYEGYFVSEYLEGYGGIDAVPEARRFLEWIRAL